MNSSPERSVVVIGDALIDEVVDSQGVRRFVGGAALNVAVGLSRLGVKAELIAMVGEDDAGNLIREFLREHGVVLWASPAPFGSMIARSERVNGEPSYSFNQAALSKAIRFGGDERAAIDRATYVCVSCFAFDDTAQTDQLISAVADEGQRLVIDPNPRLGMISDKALFARNFERAAHISRLVKVSDEDADYLDAQSVDALIASLLGGGSAAILATYGKDGAAVHAGTDLILNRPIITDPDPVVDTMGAGDSMLASAVASLTEATFDGSAVAWDRLLERSLAIAGATVRRHGALLQLPVASTEETTE